MDHHITAEIAHCQSVTDAYSSLLFKFPRNLTYHLRDFRSLLSNFLIDVTLKRFGTRPLASHWVR